MKIAILVTAYRDGYALDRLLDHLAKDFDVYLHLDCRFQYVVKNSGVVQSPIRYRSNWGSYRQVISTLELFRLAHIRGNYDRYILISGQDIPIKTNRQIIDFFGRNTREEYVFGGKAEHQEWDLGGLDRLQLFWFDYNKNVPRGLLKKLAFKSLRRFIHVVEEIIHSVQRKLSLYRKMKLQVYCGSNWINLTGSCVKYILNFLDTNPDYIPRFRHTRCGIEMFFHTIIFNSPFCNACVSRDLRYDDWQRGPERPRILRQVDFSRIISSDALFARKFDSSVDKEVIDCLYSYLESGPFERIESEN